MTFASSSGRYCGRQIDNFCDPPPGTMWLYFFITAEFCWLPLNRPAATSEIAFANDHIGKVLAYPSLVYIAVSFSRRGNRRDGGFSLYRFFGVSPAIEVQLQLKAIALCCKALSVASPHIRLYAVGAPPHLTAHAASVKGQIPRPHMPAVKSAVTSAALHHALIFLAVVIMNCSFSCWLTGRSSLSITL